MKKRRSSRIPVEEMVNVKALAGELYNVRKRIAHWKKEEEKLNEVLLKETSIEEKFIVLTMDGVKEARHQESVTPMLMSDMKTAHKKLKADFYEVISFSITKVRDLLGERWIERLKVDEKKSEFIKFYDEKEE